MNQSEIARILEDSRTHDDIQEFSDLFIQGHALNAEQMEALDQNIKEFGQKKKSKDPIVAKNIEETLDKLKAYKK